MLVLSIGRGAAAQSKTLTGEKATITATVEAIEASTRTVTLKGPKGNYLDIVVPDTVTKFDAIKVGDKITATYYENLVVRLKHPGEAATDTDATAVTRGTGAKPCGDRLDAAHHHRDHHRDRSEGAVNDLHRPARLELQLQGGRQEGARESESRRQGRHHVDRCAARLVRPCEIVKRNSE